MPRNGGHGSEWIANKKARKMFPQRWVPISVHLAHCCGFTPCKCSCRLARASFATSAPLDSTNDVSDADISRLSLVPCGPCRLITFYEDHLKFKAGPADAADGDAEMQE